MYDYFRHRIVLTMQKHDLQLIEIKNPVLIASGVERPTVLAGCEHLTHPNRFIVLQG